MSRAIAIPKRRISGGTKAAMLITALALDFSILIFFVSATILGFSLGNIAGSAFGERVGNYTKECEIRGWYDAGGALVAGVDWVGRKVFDKSFCQGLGDVHSTAWGTAATVAIDAAYGSLFMVLFPAMAAIISAISALLSVAIFTIWFLAKGVNPWGMKLSRIGLNMLTLVGESIPFLNAIWPGQTIAVYGHIRIADAEDKQKIKEATAKLRAQETRNAFMQGRGPRRVSGRAVEQQLASEGVFTA